MWFTILISAVAVALIGLILGALIGYTAKKFEVKTDPRIEEVQSMLPGANCGGCGRAGCGDMAREIVLSEVKPTECPVCTPAQAAAISKYLGRAEEEGGERKVAVVFCSGSVTRAYRNAGYNGIRDCRSASIVGNGSGKACRFGCIGFGSCARACPFGAIEMRDGLAVVHPELCKACGKCETVCPRKLIHLVPASSKVHVYCNSLDKIQVKHKNCRTACLACRKCARTAPDHFNAQGALVRVNYANPPDPSVVEQVKCPAGCLQTEESHRHLVPFAPAVKKESAEK